MSKRSLSDLFDLLWTWAERIWKVAPAIFAALVVLGTGRAAQMSAWLAAYGPISWVVTGLLGGLLFALLWWVIAVGIERYARSQWIRMAKIPSDAINPLDSVFTGRKIDMNVFRTPFTGEVVGPKTFVDCHLTGPMIVLFTGHTTLTNVTLANCDFAAIEDGMKIQNVTCFQDVTIRGGKLYFLTILIPKPLAGSIPPGANWITPH